MRDEWTDELPWIGQYILDDEGNAVPAKGLLSWGTWLQIHHEKCIVAQSTIGNARVSTVFLGLDYDHFHARLSPELHHPVLWETMVFGGPYDRHMQRYTSRDAAIEGHNKIMQMLTS